MQLFSIGLYKLNMDGTHVLDPTTNSPIPTYDNAKIQTFARAWTGFDRVQEIRGNIEPDLVNRMDPMSIDGYWRDAYPKLDLNEGYIGDGYPLCADLPNQQFLREGATYRLLGSSAVPDLHSQPKSWSANASVEEFQLTSSSNLYETLCNANSQGCAFKSVVKLQQNLPCTGDECTLDNLRVVRVQTTPPVYYEYVRPPCVDFSFYNDAKKISKTYPYEAMCANAKSHVAMNACCVGENDVAYNICKFTSERLSYSRSRSRCQNYGSGTLDTCDWTWMKRNKCDRDESEKWHWSNASCKVLAKGKNGSSSSYSYISNIMCLSKI